jgi:hypothetical protein
MVACEEVDGDIGEFISVQGLAELPWRFVGYYLCPGAEPRRALEDAERRGAWLLKMMCDYQDALSLEQLESLRMLVTAPDYTMRTLSSYLPAAAAFDLLNGLFYEWARDDEDIHVAKEYMDLVHSLYQVIFHNSLQCYYFVMGAIIL